MHNCKENGSFSIFWITKEVYHLVRRRRLSQSFGKTTWVGFHPRMKQSWRYLKLRLLNENGLVLHIESETSRISFNVPIWSYGVREDAGEVNADDTMASYMNLWKWNSHSYQWTQGLCIQVTHWRVKGN